MHRALSDPGGAPDDTRAAARNFVIGDKRVFEEVAAHLGTTRAALLLAAEMAQRAARP
jgi:hypothetical protein